MIKLNENGTLYKLFQLWEDKLTITGKTGDANEIGDWSTKGEIVWDNPKWVIIKRSSPKYKNQPYALIDRQKGKVHGEKSIMQPLLKLSKDLEENDII